MTGNYGEERPGKDDGDTARQSNDVVELNFHREWSEPAQMVAGIADNPGLIDMPVDQGGRFVLKGADDSTLIVDFDDMTFVRRPNLHSPRRALPWRFTDVTPVRLGDTPTWTIGDTRYRAATVLSIHRFDQTFFVARQQELRRQVAQGLDPTSKAGRPSLRTEWARHVMLDNDNLADALRQIVDGLRQWAALWHASETETETGDRGYDRIRVDFTDYSTDAQLTAWLREHLDENGTIW